KLLFERQSFCFQGVVKTLPTRLGIADLQRSADQADAAPAGSRQVANGIVGALVVVRDHGIVRQLWIGAHHQNEWYAHVPDHLPQRRTEVLHAFGEQDPIYPLRQQQLDFFFFLIQVIVAVTKQQVVTLFLGRVLGTANDHGKEWIGDVG